MNIPFSNALFRLPRQAIEPFVALASLIGLIRAPNGDNATRLEQALTRLAGPKDFAAYIDGMRSAPETNRMLIERYLPQPYALEDLSAHPEGTLGRGYYQHMKKHGLSADFFPKIDLDDDFSFVRLRMLQTHDIWHVLADYPADILGEVAILGFYIGHTYRYLGNGGYVSMQFMTTVLSATFLHCAFMKPRDLPEMFRLFVEGWQRGMAAQPLWAVRWEELWQRPVAELRRELNFIPR